MVLFFIVGFGLVTVYKDKQKPDEIHGDTIITSPTPTIISLSPPSQSLTGKLTEVLGTIERIPWDITSHVPATAGAVLYQGDEILTLPTSQATITIPNSLTCTMEEKTQIVLTNLLPKSITVQQRNGTFACMSQDVFNLRIPGALLELSQSTVQSVITPEEITIRIASGKGKLGFVDNENKSKVWELTAADTIVIDRGTNTIRTTGILLSSD